MMRFSSSTFLIIITFNIFLLSSFTAIGKSPVTTITLKVLEGDREDAFPVPNNIPHQLFYLQRDPNANTLMYVLNVNSKGVLDENNPVKVFWIRYTEGGVQRDLNFIQKAFAYGTLSEKNKDGSFTIRVVAYKKQEFILKKLPGETTYKIFAQINKKTAQLNRVFIRVEPGGSFWKPNIVYIELKGTELGTGKTIVERFKPA